MKSIRETLTSKGIGLAISYLDSNPEKNIPRLLDWADKFDKEDVTKKQRTVIRQVLEDEDGTWYKFAKSLWSDIDDDVRKTLFNNFIINSVIIGGKKEEKAREKYNCNIPWAILMDPTSVCNLHCTGCWAAEYGNKLSMSYETLDSIIKQGKELGTYMYIYSGGEPMVRKDDIIKLCEAHPDCAFLAFTNGTLIDEKFADEMLRVKNFVPP